MRRVDSTGLAHGPGAFTSVRPRLERRRALPLSAFFDCCLLASPRLMHVRWRLLLPCAPRLSWASFCIAPPVTPAGQGLHRRASGTHPQGELESCFGEIGNIVNIELKYVRVPIIALGSRLREAVRHAKRVGYGFVVGSIVTSPPGSRSDRSLFHKNSITAPRPRESVAKYPEGYFMRNKIRVEISHGGGRTAKHSGDPGACFQCG